MAVAALRLALSRLGAARTPLSALVTLSELDSRLGSLENSNFEAEQEADAAAGAALAGSPGASNLSRALAGPYLKSAATALRALAAELPKISQRQRKALAGGFEKAATEAGGRADVAAKGSRLHRAANAERHLPTYCPSRHRPGCGKDGGGGECSRCRRRWCQSLRPRPPRNNSCRRYRLLSATHRPRSRARRRPSLRRRAKGGGARPVELRIAASGQGIGAGAKSHGGPGGSSGSGTATGSGHALARARGRDRAGGRHRTARRARRPGLGSGTGRARAKVARGARPPVATVTPRVATRSRAKFSSVVNRGGPSRWSGTGSATARAWPRPVTVPCSRRSRRPLSRGSVSQVLGPETRASCAPISAL